MRKFDLFPQQLGGAFTGLLLYEAAEMGKRGEVKTVGYLRNGGACFRHLTKHLQKGEFIYAIGCLLQQFVETVNSNGGDTQLLVLPAIGIHGNTHASCADLKTIR